MFLFGRVVSAQSSWGSDGGRSTARRGWRRAEQISRRFIRIGRADRALRRRRAGVGFWPTVTYMSASS